MSRLLGPALAGVVLVVASQQSLRPAEPAAPTTTLPASAVCRFGSARFLNFGRVFVVAFSPDGGTLASGSWDGTVRLWEVATGKELHLFQEPKAPVRALAFAPDGKVLAYSSDGSGIVLRETATGKALRHMKAHRAPITFVAFSPDGNLLASKSWDQTFRLWNVADGSELRRLGSQDSPNQINDSSCPIVFSIDGKTVLSATLTELGFGRMPRTIRVWEVATGAELRSFKEGNSWSESLAFSPDGKLLAVATRPPPELIHSITLWDVDSGKSLRPIESDQLDHPESLSFLALSPDGRTLASRSGGSIQLWEVATRRQVCRLATPDTGPARLAWSPKGRLLASGSTDITALLWDVTGRRQNGRLESTTLSPEKFRALWDDLGGQDASTAWRALWTLVAAEDASVAFLRTSLHPAVNAASTEAITGLVADLDSRQYAVRTKAQSELAKLAELAEPALQEAEKHQPSLEQRQRIEGLLKLIVDLRSRPTGDRLRALRAVQVLEQIATPQARQLLQVLARGAVGAMTTREALAALTRFERKISANPPSQ
jgi:WD40 repeat protein